jgi:hypothetical protein
MSTIKFRVVGLYFGAKKGITGEVSIDSNDLPEGGTNDSVRDIMRVVSTNAKNGSYNGVAQFTFGSTTHGSLSTVSVLYNQEPRPHLSTGSYGLTESFRSDEHMPNYTVWQYYIYDANLEQVNFQESSFPDFTVKNPFGVDWTSQDYTVVWRLVSITQAPTKIPKESKQGRTIEKIINSSK